MKKEKQIEILMKDGCTKSEAEKFIKQGTTIYTDFEENFDDYMVEWYASEEDIEKYKQMIDTKIPATDWGVVEEDNKVYYIAYVL